VLEDPVAGALVRRRPGHTRAELHLLFEVLKGTRSGELARPARSTTRVARKGEREAGCGAREAALSDGHRGTG
jgi:hypothetical protein